MCVFAVNQQDLSTCFHSTQHAFLEPLSIMDNDLTINFSVPAVPPKQTLDFLGFVLLVALRISLSVRCRRE